MIPFSVLDLAPIVEGGDATQSFRNTLDLAQHAERWGFQRYWLAEHHNMPGIASAATSILIAHVAGGTRTIRVGAGGIMLPNHAPLLIAEQFGTLESLFPGRIDLGLGRAPGGDHAVAHALRRTLVGGPDRFPQDVVELQSYFEPPQPGQRVQAVPGAGPEGADLDPGLEPVRRAARRRAGPALRVRLALRAGRHDAGDRRLPRGFQPSDQLARPYVMLGFNVIAAESDEEARFLSTSRQQAFLNLRRGRPTRLPPPSDNVAMSWQEEAMIGEALSCSAVGSPETVRRELAAFIERTKPDELIIAAQIYDHAAQLRSFEITAQARDALS